MRVAGVICVLLGTWALSAAAQESQPLSLVPAAGLYPDRITATGRIVPLVSARIGPRVSGHIVEFGVGEGGLPLDAGMRVKAGDVLFRIDHTMYANGVARAQAALNSAQASLDNLTAPTREERLEQLRQTVAELDARLADRLRDQERFTRLVEEEKTLPARRLEEVQTEVRVLQAQRRAAEARLREAENGPTRTEIAVAQARVGEAAVALKTAQEDLRDTTVRAPFDGLITRRFRGIGDYLTSTPVTEVFEIIGTDALEAELRLPEAALASVQAGHTPLILRSGLLENDLRTTVGRVVAEVDPLKGTFAIRVPIPPDRRGRLVPGAFVTAEVSVAPASAVVIPSRAVVEGDGAAAVFVAEDGRMRRREVELGDRLTEGVVVRRGLAPGERVVVGPPSMLRDGAELPAGLVKSN